MQSVAPSISQIGVLVQWSADTTEHAHIEMIKDPAASTNHHNFNLQICCYLDRIERCRAFETATRLSSALCNGPDNGQDIPDSEVDLAAGDVDDPSAEDEDEEEHPTALLNDIWAPKCPVPNFFSIAQTLLTAVPGSIPHPIRTFTSGPTAFRLNYDPSIKRIAIDQAAEMFNIPDLCPAIADYLGCEGPYTQNFHSFGGQPRAHADVHLPFSEIQVWYKVRLQQKLHHDHTSVGPVFTINAHPANHAWEYGCHDAAILYIDGCHEWPSSGLTGHAIVEICLIMHPLSPRGCKITWDERFLVYARQFDVAPQQQSQVDPAIGLHVLKWAMHASGALLGDVFPLNQIRSYAHLVPRFGRAADPHLTIVIPNNIVRSRELSASTRSPSDLKWPCCLRMRRQSKAYQGFIKKEPVTKSPLSPSVHPSTMEHVQVQCELTKSGLIFGLSDPDYLGLDTKQAGLRTIGVWSFSLVSHCLQRLQYKVQCPLHNFPMFLLKSYILYAFSLAIRRSGVSQLLTYLVKCRKVISNYLFSTAPPSPLPINHSMSLEPGTNLLDIPLGRSTHVERACQEHQMDEVEADVNMTPSSAKKPRAASTPIEILSFHALNYNCREMKAPPRLVMAVAFSTVDPFSISNVKEEVDPTNLSIGQLEVSLSNLDLEAELQMVLNPPQSDNMDTVPRLLDLIPRNASFTMSTPPLPNPHSFSTSSSFHSLSPSEAMPRLSDSLLNISSRPTGSPTLRSVSPSMRTGSPLREVASTQELYSKCMPRTRISRENVHMRLMWKRSMESPLGSPAPGSPVPHAEPLAAEKVDGRINDGQSNVAPDVRGSDREDERCLDTTPGTVDISAELAIIQTVEKCKISSATANVDGQEDVEHNEEDTTDVEPLRSQSTPPRLQSSFGMLKTSFDISGSQGMGLRDLVGSIQLGEMQSALDRLMDDVKGSSGPSTKKPNARSQVRTVSESIFLLVKLRRRSGGIEVDGTKSRGSRPTPRIMERSPLGDDR
ncbi:hypothetical protein L210DRAFT_3672552 [Boletus edulis BED1]|uniref:DUF6830 domain-containing protein n=1 Tax=Boletus edulis BED1 TaxID=1328754 RepID=A0AAD4BDI8_BOLED|nr:hypothetical protein L210DRAFT_3672552 [Boletus edulis BED1]